MIIIDDFGDFAVVSLGWGRKLPLGRFKCETNLDLAELIQRFSDDLAVIVVNTKRNLSKVAELLLDSDNDGDHIYHFICGKGYLKALVERTIRDVKKRVSWFNGKFNSLKNSKYFFKVNAFYYNMFHHHESLGCKPFEACSGKTIRCERDVWIILAMAKRIRVNDFLNSLKFGQKVGQEILIILIVAISVKIITPPLSVM